MSARDLRIDALGSGSDYTPFLQHAGIASLNLSFGDEDQDGIYHSIYDDFYFYTRFLDTDFVVRTGAGADGRHGGHPPGRRGRAAVRVHRPRRHGAEVRTELKDLLSRKQDDVRERNRQIEDGVFAAMRDPKRPMPAPKVEAVPPAINFAPLDNAAAALADSARRYERALAASRSKVVAERRGASRAQRQAAAAPRSSSSTTPACPAAAGIGTCSTRPGFYTGYGVKTMPGVREGIEQARYDEAEAEVVRAATALTRLAALVDSASADLEGLAK